MTKATDRNMPSSEVRLGLPAQEGLEKYQALTTRGHANAMVRPTPGTAPPDWVDLTDLVSSRVGGKACLQVLSFPWADPVCRCSMLQMSGSLDVTAW